MNPNIKMQSPSKPKEVKSLMERIATEVGLYHEQQINIPISHKC